MLIQHDNNILTYLKSQQSMLIQHDIDMKMIGNFTLENQFNIMENQVLLSDILQSLWWSTLLNCLFLLLLCLVIIFMLYHVEKISKKLEEDDEVQHGAYVKIVSDA